MAPIRTISNENVSRKMEGEKKGKEERRRGRRGKNWRPFDPGKAAKVAFLALEEFREHFHAMV